MIKKNVFLIFITILFFNCNTTKELKSTWNGKTRTELIKTLGFPNIITENNDNEKIITYVNRKRRPSGYGPGKFAVIVTKKTFYINKFDVIYHVEKKLETLL